MRKKIVLIGFMGSGKTTVGKQLSESLKIPFLDMDAYIEEKYQREIKDIFSEEGEVVFRTWETEALEEILLGEEVLLVSTGGGIVTMERNLSLLEENAIVFYLKAKPETVLARLAGDSIRPLLQGEDKLEKVKELMGRRKEAYERIATHTLPVDESSVLELVEKCKKLLKKMVM